MKKILQVISKTCQWITAGSRPQKNAEGPCGKWFLSSIVLITALLSACSVFGQSITTNTIAKNTERKYWIYLSDKNNSRFNKNEPSAFLSPRAIERRNKLHIAISESDLPVNSNYIQQLENNGVHVIAASRWINAVSAYLSDEQIAIVSSMPFVRSVAPVQRYIIQDENAVPYLNNSFYRMQNTNADESILGASENQIDMINLDTLFDIGLSGAGLVIAQLDAGFFGVDTAVLFKSLWDKGQILGWHNFPDNNDQVFNIYSGFHGAWVLSVMGGDQPDEFMGTAPDADFYLYRTEIADSEHVVEEDYWMQAAERADSVGADVINSSLGYTTFDNPAEDHTYADLDGNTTIVTIAADMAAQKGILVCNSAGNEGTSDWHYISAPADADSILAVGAVDSAGFYVAFSGMGPSADGRIKPDVAAQGSGAAVMDPGGFIFTLSGTSFSSPIMAGACATLWQAFPAAGNMKIIDAVKRSASQYTHPDDSLGYGIPDFGIAYNILLSEFPVADTSLHTTTAIINISPNPAGSFFSVEINGNENAPATISVFNAEGGKVFAEAIYLNKNISSTVNINTSGIFASGMYIVSLTMDNFSESKLLFIN